MFTVGVSSHIMVAHSLPDPSFGPAARLHGATYAVAVELTTPRLDALSVVVDIGLLKRELAAVLERYAYRNLDELPEWLGRLSTTEAIAQEIHRTLAERLTGRASQATLRVRLQETPD